MRTAAEGSVCSAIEESGRAKYLFTGPNAVAPESVLTSIRSATISSRGRDRCSGVRLSALSMGGGLACRPCCPFPPGISIYQVESVDAGELVDSKIRQQTCGFDANRMKSKKGT